MKYGEHWLISVGELSGDLLAAELIHSLKEAHPQLRFSGITGPALRETGVHSVASMDELNVMGIAEVAKKLAHICMLKKWLLEYVDRNQIKVAILVDSAGFHLKLAEELKMRGVYVIQYVAPKLWAWGEHRMQTLKKNVDLLLATFPFEEKYFQERGVSCHYIGCPIVKRTDSTQTRKHELGFSKDQTLIALLPGSRVQELNRLLKPMLSIAQKIKRLLPNAEFIVPIAPSLRDVKNKAWILSHQQNSVHFVEKNSLDIMHAADVALVASGTATLECALVNTPLAVIYEMNPLSYWFAKKNVRVQWASLVNILRSKLLVQEYIQNYDEGHVAQELLSLVQDAQKRKQMLAEFSEIKESLSKPSTLTAVGHISNALSMMKNATS